MFTRKICPFITLAVATAGCGKKINEAAIVPETTTQNQVRPSMVIVSSLSAYVMDQDLNFEVPETVRVKEGDPTNRTAELTYNLDEFEDYEMKCRYASNGSQNEMVLVKCIDYYGYNLGNVSGHTFSLLNGLSVTLKANFSVSPLVIEAIHAIEQ